MPLADDEIILSKKQFEDIWGCSNAISGKHLTEKVGLKQAHLTQMPDYFFNDFNPIYCISLLEWIEKKFGDNMYLEQNPIFLSILSDKKPQVYKKYLLNKEKEFYNKRDIKRIMGLTRGNDAIEWIRSHKFGIKINREDNNGAEEWVISKKILDSELKLAVIGEEHEKISRSIKNRIILQMSEMRKVNEIDADKTLMLLSDKGEKYSMEIKKCQDDCKKSADCEFFESRDNKGLRSGCIYVMAHIKNILNQLAYHISSSDKKDYMGFIRRQQFRILINLEAKHKYACLQQPYMETLRKKETKYGPEYILCESEIELSKNDALIQKMWKDLKLDPPKSVSSASFGDVISENSKME